MRIRNLPYVFLILSAILLTSLTSTTAEARYYGGHYSFGHGHHGGHSGIHFGYRGHYGYPHRYYRKHHYYRHGYRGYYHKPYYYGRNYYYRPGYKSHGGRYRHHSLLYGLLAAPAYLAYGILKTPAVIVESLAGARHHSSRHDSGHRGHDDDLEHRRHDPRNTSGSENNRSDAYHDDKPASSGVAPVDNAWALLQQQQYRQALQEFGTRATAQPEEGIHKIGYALAAAGSGDLQRGDWAMKRALRYDRDAFHYIEVDDSVQGLVSQLIREYESHGNGDSVVTLSMLYYLSGDKSKAKQIIQRNESLISDRSVLNDLNHLFRLDEENA